MNAKWVNEKIHLQISFFFILFVNSIVCKFYFFEKNFIKIDAWPSSWWLLVTKIPSREAYISLFLSFHFISIHFFLNCFYIFVFFLQAIWIFFLFFFFLFFVNKNYIFISNSKFIRQVHHTHKHWECKIRKNFLPFYLSFDCFVFLRKFPKK